MVNGTISSTTDGNGSIVTFAVNGTLPPSFKIDSNVLANDHNSWDITGTRTITAPHQEVVMMSGTVKSFSGATTENGTLTVKQGKWVEIPVTAEGYKPGNLGAPVQGTLSEATFDVTWATATDGFDGTVALTDAMWDKTGHANKPTKLTIAGALRNIEGGVTTEFFSGSLVTTLGGYANYDATVAAADSASNFTTNSTTFSGSVTAPNRPKLELSIGLGKRSYDANPTISAQYRTFVNGTPRQVIGITSAPQANGARLLTVSEATSALSLTVPSNATTGSLKSGTEQIGTLNIGSNVITFSDGSFASFDLAM